MEARDEIPPNLADEPPRLIEYRPCWEAHALLRFHRVPYTCESSGLRFALGRPLPLVVHGSCLHSTRARVLEHLASYRPHMRTSTTSTTQQQQLEVVGLADDGTLTVVYLDKMTETLQAYKFLTGIERKETWAALPLLHACVNLWERDLASLFINTSPEWVLPDTTEEDLLCKLDVFYAALARHLTTLKDKNRVLASVVDLPPSPPAVVESPKPAGSPTSRRMSAVVSALFSPSSPSSSSSSSSSSSAASCPYVLADAVLFAHLTTALSMEKPAALLAKYPIAGRYHANIVASYFSNSSSSSNEGEGEGEYALQRDRATLALLTGNAFCRYPSTCTSATPLTSLLAFDVEVARRREEEAGARQTSSSSSSSEAALAVWIAPQPSTARVLFFLSVAAAAALSLSAAGRRRWWA